MRTPTNDEIVARVVGWAESRRDIRALLVVGSYARGSATATSDVDLVVLTESPARYLEDEGWVRDVGGVEVVRTRAWGPLTERRVRFPSGLEVEFGFVRPSWAWMEPIEPGTRQVLDDGCRLLLDKDGVVTPLLARLASEHPPPD
jgi:predicted nucleotidyltransferase